MDAWVRAQFAVVPSTAYAVPAGGMAQILYHCQAVHHA
jgi:hypothetical protein